MNKIADAPELQNASVHRNRSLTSVILIPIAVCIAIVLLSQAVPKIAGKSTPWIFFPGFFSESTLLVSSLALSAWLSRGRLARFGFTKGSFRLTPAFFLWLLPMLVISTLQAISSPASANATNPVQAVSPIGIIIAIWIYASICEEIFTRGLLQTWLSPLAKYRIRMLRKWPLSVPVLLSALFFGGMHIVLWPKLGPATLVVIFLATILGLIAGYYREKTGSLLPAILIHAFFDIGGTVPLWISAQLISRHM